jgi:TetR/AcrR family transcriptional regulator
MDAPSRTARMTRGSGCVGRRHPTEFIERLMKVAFDAFVAYGYEGASMRQIAKEAGTTIQRVLYHVRSKEELWKQVMKRVVDRYDLRKKTLLESLGDAPAAIKLRHLINDMVTFQAEMPGIHRLMTSDAARANKRLTWLCQNYLLAQVREMVELIKDAQRDGVVKRVDPARLRYAILSISAVPFAIAAEFQATTGHNPFDGEEVQRTIDFICELVFVDEPPSQSGPKQVRTADARPAARKK